MLAAKSISELRSHLSMAKLLHIRLDGMANVELLRMGFVKLRIVPPNVKYENNLDLAYQQAKKEKRGLEGY